MEDTDFIVKRSEIGVITKNSNADLLHKLLKFRCSKERSGGKLLNDQLLCVRVLSGLWDSKAFAQLLKG